MEELSKFPESHVIAFGDDTDSLEFCRTKERGGICQIQFNERIWREKSGELKVEDQEP